MSNLIDKFISNTYTGLLQKSGVVSSEGSENPNLETGLTNDSESLVNGIGMKATSLVLDMGDPSGATMGYGIYFQTTDHKVEGDYGIRLSSINERGEITSFNKDILISSDNSTDSNSLTNKRRTILNGGISGSMSVTSDADDLIGGLIGDPEQLTLILQGRLSVEHDDQILLDSEKIHTLGIMSGVFRGDGNECQVWQKMGNVIKVSGNWRYDPSSIGIGPSTVSMYDLEQLNTNYILPLQINSTPVSYDTSTGVYTVNQSGNYTISGTIKIRYKRTSAWTVGSIGATGFYALMRPNIDIVKNNSVTLFSQVYDVHSPVLQSGGFYNAPVAPSSVGVQSNWIEMPFTHQSAFIVNDTFNLKYSIGTGIASPYFFLTNQFEVEFGDSSFLSVILNANETIISSMGSGSSTTSFDGDLPLPVINGNPVEKVYGSANFQDEVVQSGSIRKNPNSSIRSTSVGFYLSNSYNIQSSGPVDFSYTYVLDF